MTGASCLARVVVPRTAAAVDHADTELIGHRGWEDTGFLCGGKQLRLRLLFVFMKAITLRHVSNCHFERSEAESRNLLPPCSPPLHWPHSIERNAGSFPRWQFCIGLPSWAKLALRRAAMEQHYHFYPRTPYGPSRGNKN